MKEFARQRLQKASEAAEAARLLAGEDSRDAAADRAYYAMFYAVEALLSEQDLTFSRHGAVHGGFGRLFAKTGELDPKYHRWLIQAFEARQTAIYGHHAPLQPRLARVRPEERYGDAAGALEPDRPPPPSADGAVGGPPTSAASSSSSRSS